VSRTFADHFSAGAKVYARHRPRYPAALAQRLAELAPGRELAWDAGCGSGQAATLLAGSFTRVRATDASARQLAHAEPHPRVDYAHGREDASGLPDGSADLVAVAQALHWFDLEAFHGEARRVLRPGGLIAQWSYSLARVDPVTDAAVERFYRERVGRHWPPERLHVENGYRELAFPFESVEAGVFAMEAHLDRDAMLDYIGTWSAVTRCRETEGADPLPELAAALAPGWPDPGELRRVRWPLMLRVGRV
jgi:SAM-dependent methyltransferase